MRNSRDRRTYPGSTETSYADFLVIPARPDTPSIESLTVAMSAFRNLAPLKQPEDSSSSSPVKFTSDSNEATGSGGTSGAADQGSGSGGDGKDGKDSNPRKRRTAGSVSTMACTPCRPARQRGRRCVPSRFDGFLRELLPFTNFRCMGQC